MRAPTKIDLNPWTAGKAQKIPLLRQEPRVRRKHSGALSSGQRRKSRDVPALSPQLLHQIQMITEPRRLSPSEPAALRSSRKLSTLSYRQTRRRKPGGHFPLRSRRTPESLPLLEGSSTHLFSPAQGRSCPSLERPLLKETVSVVLEIPQVFGDHHKSRLRKKVEGRMWDSRVSATTGDWSSR